LTRLPLQAGLGRELDTSNFNLVFGISILKLIIGVLLCAQFVCVPPAAGAQASELFIPHSRAESTAATNAKAALSFSEAARKTLAAHPQFRQFSLALAAAQARETQAALKPGLELSGALENVLGSGTVSGVKGTELSLTLSSVFERGDKRGARLDVAQSASALLSLQNRIDALDVLTETGRSFVALAAAQEAHAAAKRALKLAQATLSAIMPRVQAAQAPETEALNAEIAQVEALLQVGHAQRRIEAAQYALALSWNAPNAKPSAIMEIYRMPKVADVADLIAQIDFLPDIAQYGAQTRLAQAELGLARAQAVTDWRWNAGVRRLEASNDQAFVVGISIPLGQAKRQLSFVREAELNSQLPDLAAQATRLRLKTLLFGALKDLRSAVADEQVVREQQLPQAKKVMQLTMAGYDLGRYAYRDVALAQAQVQALELKRLNAAQAYHLARIEIERLTGAQLNILAASNSQISE
jgi:cobalt-zinc-cadmium efflux system outer membrane protein